MHMFIQSLIIVFSLGITVGLLFVMVACAVCMLHRARGGKFCCLKAVKINNGYNLYHNNINFGRKYVIVNILFLSNVMIALGELRTYFCCVANSFSVLFEFSTHACTNEV